MADHHQIDYQTVACEDCGRKTMTVVEYDRIDEDRILGLQKRIEELQDRFDRLSDSDEEAEYTNIWLH